MNGLLSHDKVHRALSRGVEVGLERGFPVACGVVDAEGRPRGVLRHDDALWITADLALGKATLASGFREHTQELVERWSTKRPFFAGSVQSWGSGTNLRWFVGEGGCPLRPKGDEKTCLGAVGVSGCLPATIDQEIADAVGDFLLSV